MKKLAFVALLVSTTITPAFAGDIYVVGAIGYSNIDTDKGELDRDLAAAGATGISSSLDKNDVGYKFQVGYQFNKYFAVEGGYVDLGKTSYSARFTGGTANADVKVSGPNIAVLGILPLNDSFSVFGKLGGINARVKANVSATGPGGSASASTSSTDFQPNFGIGAIYHVNKQFGIRVELERFSDLGDSSTTGKSDVDLASVGVVFKF